MILGNHEDKIDRIVKLEDRIAELLNAAQQQKEEASAEIKSLKAKIQQAEKNSNVPSELQSKEDAYRQTIAEADSLLSKMEADYQTTIKVLHKNIFKFQNNDQKIKNHTDFDKVSRIVREYIYFYLSNNSRPIN